MTSPRSVRNNNPGNIEHQGAFRWYGELDPDPAIEPRFARFDTPAHGFRALAKNLLGYQRTHGLRTIRQIVNRWAPPVENETTAYVAAVARALRVHPDDPLDLGNPLWLAELAKAIATHETGGWLGWWREDDLELGVALALEIPVAAVAAAEAAPAGQGEAIGTAPVSSSAPGVSDDPGASAAAAAPDSQRPDPVRDFNAYNPLADLGRSPMPLPIVPIVAALLPQIIAALPDLARIISRTPAAPGADKPTVPERNVQVLEKVGEIITSATGEPTVEGAVRKLQVDPAARETAAREVRMSFPELLELSRFDEDSRREARRFGAEMLAGASANLRALAYGAVLFTIALIVVAGGGWMLREVLIGGDTPAETKGMIIGGILTAIASVLAFFFGSSASSRGKDQALQVMAERR